jgi:hypothetical protein
MVGPAAGSKLCCGLGELDDWAPGKDPAAELLDEPLADELPLPPPHAASARAAEQATPSADMRVRVRRAGVEVVRVRMVGNLSNR